MIAGIVYSLTDAQKLIKGLAPTSIDNTLLVGFFLRDDKPEYVKQFMPEYLSKLKDLEKNGLEHNGKKYKVDLTVTADFKFLRLFAGLQEGEPSHGCSTCLCNHDNYHLTLAELEALAASEAGDDPDKLKQTDERSQDLSDRLLHKPKTHPDGYKCPACGDTIKPGHKEDRATDGGSFPNKNQRDERCKSHYNVAFEWFYTMILGYKFVMDLLHNKLRIVPQLYFWTVSAALNGQADRELEVCTPCMPCLYTPPCDRVLIIAPGLRQKPMRPCVMRARAASRYLNLFFCYTVIHRRHRFRSSLTRSSRSASAARYLLRVLAASGRS